MIFGCFAVFAVESKSRKTEFLNMQARHLPNLQVITADINQISRTTAFDVDYVTAKAFKPLEKVIGIASRAIYRKAELLVPVSTNQISLGANEGLIDPADDLLWVSGYSYFSRALCRDSSKSRPKFTYR